MTDTMTDWRESLGALFRELIDGPEEQAGYVLNPGDVGLLRSLERLSAGSASAKPPTGGSSIAAHVDHLKYGLSLLNRWSRGEHNPWASADWSASWQRTHVSPDEWAQLQRELTAEARAWSQNIGVRRDYSIVELNGVLASVAHLAYHLGAIRQIDRSLRGPAEGGS
jgi:hypothetical protein